MTNFLNKSQIAQPPKRESYTLPTRQELAAFLKFKGENPERLKRMSAWEQVQLTKEYQRLVS